MLQKWRVFTTQISKFTSVRCYTSQVENLVTDNHDRNAQAVFVKEQVQSNSMSLDELQFRKRLLLNSRYRGRVETELFLGGFAAQNIWNLSLDDCKEYELILAEHDIDLYNYIMNIKPTPEEISNLKVYSKIMDYVNMKKNLNKVRVLQQEKRNLSKDEILNLVKIDTFKEDYDGSDGSIPETKSQ